MFTAQKVTLFSGFQTTNGYSLNPANLKQKIKCFKSTIKLNYYTSSCNTKGHPCARLHAQTLVTSQPLSWAWLDYYNYTIELIYD